MLRLIQTWMIFCAIVTSSHCVSTKEDFGEEFTSISTNSSKVEDEDVEVKHTIVVSTKLKNNNRRGGIHSAGDGDSGTLTYNIGRTEKSKKDDSYEVPVLNGYKAVETTQIRTPDSRHKTSTYPDSVFVNRNIRDEYDIYPNIATNPNQWKPSTFYNNINWWNQDNRDTNNFERRNDRPAYQKSRALHRKLTDDGMKEFYCRKCRELTNGQGYKGCIQQRSTPFITTTTTPKVKVDGKLAKLN